VLAIDIPRPIDQTPSCLGISWRRRQPKTSAASVQASRSLLDDHGLSSKGSRSAKFARRRSRGSTPSAIASSSMALSSAQLPGPSIGARIGQDFTRLMRSMNWSVSMFGQA
jgi:hypothetical protein